MSGAGFGAGAGLLFNTPHLHANAKGSNHAGRQVHLLRRKRRWWRMWPGRPPLANSHSVLQHYH